MNPIEFGQKLRAEKEAVLGSMIRGVKETFQTPAQTQMQRLQSADSYMDKGLLSRMGGAMWDPVQAGRNARIANQLPQQAMMGKAMAIGAQAAPQLSPAPAPGAQAAPASAVPAAAPAPVPAAPKQASFAGEPMGPPPGAMTDGAQMGLPNMFGMSTTGNFHPANTGLGTPQTGGFGNMSQHMSRSGWQPGGANRVPGTGPNGRGGLLMPGETFESIRSSMPQPGMGQQMPNMPKNVIGDMLKNDFANEGGRMNNGMGDMAMKMSHNKVASALVAMAVYRAAELEKEAGGLGRLFSGIGSAVRTAPAAIAAGAKTIGNAGKFVNTGAKNFLRASGNALQGGGQVGQAVGGVASRVGRFGQQMGTGIIGAAENIPTRMLGTNAGRPIRDVAQAAGHAVRATSSVLGGAGGGVGIVGKGMNAAGQGLKRVSQMGGPIPTIAALPVAAGAAMAARPFVPNVGLQNPIANMSTKFQSPVTVNWDKK